MVGYAQNNSALLEIEVNYVLVKETCINQNEKRNK